MLDFISSHCGRYLQECIPKDKRGTVPPDDYIAFRMQLQHREPKDDMGQADRLNAIIKQALQGIDWSKCKWILIPILDGEHHSLVVLKFVGKSKNTASYQVLKSLEGIRTDEPTLKR